MEITFYKYSLQQSWEEHWHFTRERTETDVPGGTCAVASCESLGLTLVWLQNSPGSPPPAQFGRLDEDPSQPHRLCGTFHWARRCSFPGQKAASGRNFVILPKMCWTSGFLTWDLRTLWNCLQNVICGSFGWKMSESIVLIKFSEWFLTQDDLGTTALCH